MTTQEAEDFYIHAKIGVDVLVCDGNEFKRYRGSEALIADFSLIFSSELEALNYFIEQVKKEIS